MQMLCWGGACRWEGDNEGMRRMRRIMTADDPWSFWGREEKLCVAALVPPF
jgi:hypothetical protein